MQLYHSLSFASAACFRFTALRVEAQPRLPQPAYRKCSRTSVTGESRGATTRGLPDGLYETATRRSPFCGAPPHSPPLFGCIGHFSEDPIPAAPASFFRYVTAPTAISTSPRREAVRRGPRRRLMMWLVSLLAPQSLQLPKIWRTDGEPATGGRLLMATSFASRSPRACARRSTPPVRTSGTTAQCCAPGSKKLRKQVLFG